MPPTEPPRPDRAQPELTGHAGEPSGAPSTHPTTPETGELPVRSASSDGAPGDSRSARRPLPGTRVWTRLRTDRAALVGLALIALTLLAVVFADLITGALGVDTETYHTDLLDPYGVPAGPLGGVSLQHPFGVEPQTGRDLFATVVHGARISIVIGLGATLLSVAIGVAIGILAGYVGGVADVLASRFIDVMLGFPSLIFMIAISAIVPFDFNRVLLMVLILGVFGWPSIARVVRAETMSLRARPFVRASRSLGASNAHIIGRHILPNLWATIIVFSTISIPGKIGAEAALSFLGVGVRPPTASWGRTISNAVNWIATDPWYLLFPGAALFLVTYAFNVFGDGLRDALDPTTQVGS
ncbi:ABC transporter permease [Propioniciclava soli]|uniref:ABC transporter permease n=1 Tax=Propioniciclava soli TaxID=2775081 RepID=A0ABZ3C5N1_9ACTN